MIPDMIPCSNTGYGSKTTMIWTGDAHNSWRLTNGCGKSMKIMGCDFRLRHDLFANQTGDIQAMLPVLEKATPLLSWPGCTWGEMLVFFQDEIWENHGKVIGKSLGRMGTLGINCEVCFSRSACSKVFINQWLNRSWNMSCPSPTAIHHLIGN